MKPFLSQALLVALAATATSFGQTEAKTTPVGYVKLGNNGTAPSGSDTYVSLPVERTAEFIGQAGQAASANSITLSGAAFTTNQWQDDSDTPPYFLKIESGAKSGLIALIASNTAAAVTVAPGVDLTGVLAGDKVTIRKAWTVKSIFEGAVLPAAGVQLFAFDGTENGTNIQPNDSWAWDGANWNNNNTLEIDNDAVLYPGEALIIRNASGTAVTSLMVSGDVTIAKSLVSVRGGSSRQDNPIAFIASADESILSSGVSSIAVAGDSILVIPNDLVAINKSASKTYDYDGAGWMDGDTLEYIGNSVKFEAGKSYIYRRAAGAPAATTWSDAPDYASSLSN